MSLHAAVGAVTIIGYSPTIKEVQGQVPYGATYPLTITSPSNLASGTPVTVTFRVTVNGFLPGGVSPATAISYVTFSQTTLTFTQPNQQQTVTVNFAVPVDAVPGQYGYQVYTDGWPAGLGATNEGTSINATVSLPPVLNPPAVLIGTPADGSEILLTPPNFIPIDVPFTFTATSTGVTRSPITSVDADVDGVAVTLTTGGINTYEVTASGTLRITSLGSHRVTARATNAGGTAEDINSFVVKVSVAPPVASFDTDKPKPATSYTYTYYAGLNPGETGVEVPITGRGVTTLGGLQNVVVSLADGTELMTTKQGLSSLASPGSLFATASTTRRHAVAGDYTLRVVATDIFGQISAPATVTYRVQVVSPLPDVTAPVVSTSTAGVTTSTGADGVVTFTLPVGATTLNLNYGFLSTSNAPFLVDTVGALLDGTPLAGPSAPNTNPSTPTANRSSTGTIANLGVGTYSIRSTCTSSGVSDTETTQFVIKAQALVPPSIVFNPPTPAAGTTLTRTGATLSVPISFTGTSNNASTVITAVTATLNGAPISGLSTTALNQQNVTGTATLTITAAGTYTIRATATDAVGTATTERVFYVRVTALRDITGEVFFDVDGDKQEDADEFGLSGITVQLRDSSNALVKTAVTNSAGYYKFEDVAPGAYTVVGIPTNGLKVTTTNHSVTVASSDTNAPDIGMNLDLPAFRAMSASGFTIGYWKNNIDKAIAGKTGGTQVSKATLCNYTDEIADFGLSPYDGISLKTASATMGYNGSNPASLLSKQLVASEYNYQNGAYLGGNRTLTFLFIYWGEYVLNNSNRYSSAYLIWAKDWFDAYNNSHGGLVAGPQ